MSKNYINGCLIKTTNELSNSNNSHVTNFVLKYMSYYLSPEIFYGISVSPITEGKTEFNVTVKENKDLIEILVDGDEHISLTKNGYHDAQLMCEQFSNIHGVFFKEIRNIRVNGDVLMKHHLQIN
jgi:hypothetical protein